MNDIKTTTEWWSSKRFNYNKALVISGISAFILYVSLGSIFSADLPGFEITIFTIILQGIGYLIAMLFANLFYFLGPITETILKPKNIDGFRSKTYNLGKWFSVLLPFSIPLMIIITIINSKG